MRTRLIAPLTRVMASEDNPSPTVFSRTVPTAHENDETSAAEIPTAFIPRGSLTRDP